MKYGIAFFICACLCIMCAPAFCRTPDISNDAALIAYFFVCYEDELNSHPAFVDELSKTYGRWVVERNPGTNPLPEIARGIHIGAAQAVMEIQRYGKRCCGSVKKEFHRLCDAMGITSPI